MGVVGGMFKHEVISITGINVLSLYCKRSCKRAEKFLKTLS